MDSSFSLVISFNFPQVYQPREMLIFCYGSSLLVLMLQHFFRVFFRDHLAVERRFRISSRVQSWRINSNCTSYPNPEIPSKRANFDAILRLFSARRLPPKCWEFGEAIIFRGKPRGQFQGGQFDSQQCCLLSVTFRTSPLRKT